MSVNAHSQIITAVVVTPGNKPDGQQFEQMVKEDEKVRVQAGTYAGDKAYDDGENHELLRSKGKSSALCLSAMRTPFTEKAYRTEKYPEGLWVEIKGSAE